MKPMGCHLWPLQVCSHLSFWATAPPWLQPALLWDFWQDALPSLPGAALRTCADSLVTGLPLGLASHWIGLFSV